MEVIPNDKKTGVNIMNKVKNCKAYIYIMLIIGTIVLSACNSNVSKDEKANSAGVSDERKEISFIQGMSTNQSINEVYEKLVENYNNGQDEVKVNLKLTDYGDGGGGNDHRTYVTTQLIGGTTDEIIQSRYIWSHDDYGKDLI